MKMTARWHDGLAPTHPEPLPLLVVGGSRYTLDLLRIVSACSDEIVLVVLKADAGVQRFCQRFGVEFQERAFEPADLNGVAAVLVTCDAPELESMVVCHARHRGVPAHAFGSPHLCDFTLVEMLERRALCATENFVPLPPANDGCES